MIFKGRNAVGESVYSDSTGCRFIKSDGSENVDSLLMCNNFNPYSEFANPRFVTVQEHVESVCRSNEGRGIWSIGVNAALREMNKHWASHLAEGHPKTIVIDDVREMQINLLEVIAELMGRLATRSGTNEISHVIDV